MADKRLIDNESSTTVDKFYGNKGGKDVQIPLADAAAVLADNRAKKIIQTSSVNVSRFKLCSSIGGRNSCSFIVSSARIEGGVFDCFLVAFNITNSGSLLSVKAKALIKDSDSDTRLYYYKDGSNIDIYLSIHNGFMLVNILPLYVLSSTTDINPSIVSEIPDGAVEITTE